MTDTVVTDEVTPVFLELGKALYICQAFEGTLVLMLSLISHEEADAEDDAFTSAMDIYSQKTLGKLIGHLGEKINLPTEVEAHLKLGWERRNAIVHRFVHDHGASLLDPKGREEAEKLLVKFKQEVKFADIVANRLLDVFLKKYDLTVEDLKRNADRLWEDLNPVADEISTKH